MTPPRDTDAQRLERKIDALAEKVELIQGQFEKIGRLEERIAAYMGIAERIEQANQQDVRDLNTKYADHEARLRSLEATNTATTARGRIADGAVTRVLIPAALVVLGFLASEWARGRTAPQVTVTSAPVINPAPERAP